MPRHELERIHGRLHISTYCEREAEKEYAAWLVAENYEFRTPEIDGEGYLLSPIEIGICNLDRKLNEMGLHKKCPDN